MSVTEFSNNPQATSPETFAADADGFNAELQARLDDITNFGEYIDRRSEDASGHSIWVSSSSYVDGDVVYSPTDLLPYRANKDIAVSVTDPQADGGTDWVSAGGVSAAQQAKLDHMTVTEAVDLDQVGAGQTFTADGAITAGEVVVLKTDGDVASVTSSTSAVDSGTEESVNTSDAGNGGTAVAAMGSGKFAFVYYDASAQIRAIIGTYSGGSWTWGTAQDTGLTAATYNSVYYDETTGNLVFFGHSYNSTLEAIAASVSGTVLTFGTKVNVQTGVLYPGNAVCENGYVTISYLDNTPKAKCSQINGTTLSFGTEAEFETSVTGYMIGVDYSAADDAFIFVWSETSNDKIAGCVATRSGTTLTAGSAYTIDNQTANCQATVAVAALGTGKFFCFFKDRDDSDYHKGVVVSYSGTTISGIGTIVSSSIAGTIYWSANVIEKVGDYLYVNFGNASSYAAILEWSVSGDTVTFEQEIVYDSPHTNQAKGLSYDSVLERLMVCWNDSGSGDDVLVRDFTPSILTTDADDWIGIAQETVADAADVLVKQQGAVDANQSSLTVGISYYVDDDGALTSVANSRKIGRAVAATELYLTESTS